MVLNHSKSVTAHNKALLIGWDKTLIKYEKLFKVSSKVIQYKKQC